MSPRLPEQIRLQSPRRPHRREWHQSLDFGRESAEGDINDQQVNIWSIDSGVGLLGSVGTGVGRVSLLTRETHDHMVQGELFDRVTVVTLVPDLFAFVTLDEIHEFVLAFQEQLVLLVEQFGVAVFALGPLGTEAEGVVIAEFHRNMG